MQQGTYTYSGNSTSSLKLLVDRENRDTSAPFPSYSYLTPTKVPAAYHATPPSASTPATPAGGADSVLVLTIKPIALHDSTSDSSEDEDGSELFPYDPLLDDDRARILDVGCGLYDDHGNLLETCEQLIKPEGDQLLPPHEDSPARKKALQKKASASGIGWNEAIRQLEPLIRRAGLIVCHDTKVDRQALSAAFVRHGCQHLASDLQSKPAYSTKEGGKQFLWFLNSVASPRSVVKYPSSLAALHKALFDEGFHGHRALSHTLAIARSYFMMEKGVDIDRPSAANDDDNTKMSFAGSNSYCCDNEVMVLEKSWSFYF